MAVFCRFFTAVAGDPSGAYGAIRMTALNAQSLTTFLNIITVCRYLTTYHYQ